MALLPFFKRYVSTENLLLFAIIMYLARNIIICMAPSIPVLLFGIALQGASYGIFTASITSKTTAFLQKQTPNEITPLYPSSRMPSS